MAKKNSKEKYNLVQELTKRSEKLKGKDRLALVGQGDFPGANNVMRSTMNIKHHSQRLTIDNPEFPFFYDGKENVVGKHSTFYVVADKPYRVMNIIKKYDQLLHGKSKFALYFLYCDKDDSWMVVERKEVENLTENFGFDYNTEYLDDLEVGDLIPKDQVITCSTSYDEWGNTGAGVNGRIIYAVHPGVVEDAIIISESFAKRMVTNNVKMVTIPVTDNTLLLNLYGDKDEYKGLPDIGTTIKNGIIAATRTIKDSRMFSDLRDSFLSITNDQSDIKYYDIGLGEVIDIDVYCNNPDIQPNKINKQIYQYYKDCRWFYTEVYKQCKRIQKSGSKNIDRDINYWMKKAQDYLNDSESWTIHDDIYSNVVINILIRSKEPIRVGRKIVGRHGTNIVVHVKLG